MNYKDKKCIILYIREATHLKQKVIFDRSHSTISFRLITSYFQLQETMNHNYHMNLEDSETIPYRHITANPSRVTSSGCNIKNFFLTSNGKGALGLSIHGIYASLKPIVFDILFFVYLSLLQIGATLGNLLLFLYVFLYS